MHAGREPASPAYGIDTRALCSAAAVDRVMTRHPGLRLVVPHLGADEFAEYDALLDRHEGLFLDTTMAISGHLPQAPEASFLARRAGRLLYGSDFPDIPYVWSHELAVLAAAGLDPGALRAIASTNARRLFLGEDDFSPGRDSPANAAHDLKSGAGESMPTRRAPSPLSESAESYRLLVSSVRDYAIYMLDATGHVASWNLGAERIKGYAADEIMGKYLSVFYTPEDVQAGKPEKELAHAAAEGRFEDDGWRLRKDGSRFWANVIITALRGPGAEPIGFVKITRDLTERRNAEEQRLALTREKAARREAELRSEERAQLIEELAKVNIDRQGLIEKLSQALAIRDDFLSAASHELKTPLYTLQLQLASAQRFARGPAERLEKRLKSAELEIQRIARLINNLLDVSRITSNRLSMSPEQMDLVQLAREVIERDELEIQRFGSTVTLQAPPSLAGFWDRMRIDQILTNLLSNALKYGEKKPVTITIAGEGDKARIVVADQGLGIDPRDQARIFERFERVVTTRAQGGLGLGLWIVREIVEAMGGKIALESRAGLGATFTVELPMRQAKPDQGAGDAPGPQ
jgi:PAS domain S-box-containing protein